MKIIAFVFFCFAFMSTSYAQSEEQEPDDSVGISGYISPFFKTTAMVVPSYFVGGSGAIFIDQNIFVGGFGYSMTNYFKIDRGGLITNGKELDLGGGGLLGGYVFYAQQKIHPIASIWLGAGSISVSDKNKTRIKEAYDDFYYLNATLEIEYRIIKNLAIGAGAHYQLINGLKLDGYSEQDFSGPGVYINIKAGIF
jgi:hypothetical protein